MCRKVFDAPRTCTSCRSWQQRVSLYTCDGGSDGHVIAAAILLYRRIALRAFLSESLSRTPGNAYDTHLGVGRDPIGRLRVVRALLEPELDEGADARLVVVAAAAKAEGVAAGAGDGGDDRVERLGGDVALNRVGAVATGAPAEGGVVVDVGPVQQPLVPVGGISRRRSEGAGSGLTSRTWVRRRGARPSFRRRSGGI
jgi:hypothetical protein